MSSWKEIKSIPIGTTVDVWAVREILPNGEKRLDERRWPDVEMVRRKLNGSDQVFELWQGVPDGWVPTHWRPVPKGP